MMNKIKTYQQYQKANQKLKDKGKIKYRNNFLMKNDIEELINDNKIYLYEADDVLIIFKEERDHELLYFSSIHDSFKIPQRDKASKLEYIYRGEYDSNLINNIINQDFKILANTQEMYRSPCEFENKKIGQYNLEQAEIEDFDEINAIWSGTLDPILNPLPDKDEFSNKLSSIYKLVDKNEILACTVVEEKGNNLLIEHFSSKKELIGKGMGQILINEIFNKYQERKISLWVDLENKRAINFYKKNGFKTSAKKSIVFIRR